MSAKKPTKRLKLDAALGKKTSKAAIQKISKYRKQIQKDEDEVYYNNNNKN